MATEHTKEADPPSEAPPPSVVQTTEHEHAEAPAPPVAAASTTTAQTPATAGEQPQAQAADHEEAPDPDEDDLSDLDDVLDEFAATNITKPDAPSSSGPGRPTPAAPSGPSIGLPGIAPGAAPAGAGPGGLFADEDEFAKSLQAGMAELLGEFQSNPDMQRQFEDLVKELGEGMGSVDAGELGIAPDTSRELAGGADGAAGAAPSAGSVSAEAGASSASTAKSTAPQPSFEDTIRATMERMSASSAAASDAASKSAANPDEDFLAAMLKELERDGGAGLGMGNDEDFSKMLLGMMEQLTNKEILYEPMKELHDKFPAWMRDNKDKTKKDDLERYTLQQKLVGEIVAKFEEKGYKDGDVEAREYIVERMQQMQAAGSPPPDLVGDMNAAQEALGDLDAGCPQQ